MRAVGDVHAPERRRMPAEAPPAGRQGFSTACDSGHNAENPLRIYGCPQTTSTQSTVEESHLRLCEMFRLRFAPPRYSPVIGGGGENNAQHDRRTIILYFDTPSFHPHNRLPLSFRRPEGGRIPQGLHKQQIYANRAVFPAYLLHMHVLVINFTYFSCFP